MKRLSLLFLLFPIVLAAQSSERGTLLLPQHPAEINRFVNPDGTLHLQEVRTTCHLLTDNGWLAFDELPLPRRKKAIIRHIKTLNEQLEQYWYDHRQVDSAAYEWLYELAFYERSFLQKADQQQHPQVTFRQKITMGWSSMRSSRVFRYRIPNDVPATLPADPEASPFWHRPADSIPLYKQFDRLAKAKKIKAKKHLVVVFDQLSTDGSAPKIDAMDPDLDNGWSLKWGDEVHTDVVGSRLFAALGYDVDHPYYYEKNALTLVIPDTTQTVRNATDLIARIQAIYQLDLTPFINESGVVTAAMIEQQNDLAPFAGWCYIRFTECAVEARPDRVKRIGSFLPEALENQSRQSLRGSLLAHQFIGNWDTREANTLLTQVHTGDYNYRVSAVFSDLGTSLGVARHTFPPDFKTGLVNELPWEAVERTGTTIRLKQPVNALLSCYTAATYDDLRWMAAQIARVDSVTLRRIIQKAGWPDPVAELYFHKLAARRHSILEAFQVPDPHPIPYDRSLTIVVEGTTLVLNGKLLPNEAVAVHPESLTRTKGRFRNYGH